MSYVIHDRFTKNPVVGFEALYSGLYLIKETQFKIVFKKR